MLRTIAEMITWLRACETWEHCYDFQRYLFSRLYEAQERHQECSRIVKRLSRRGALPVDAPAPPPTGDPLQLETWELELYVYERLIRQLRTVGDGFAWTCFGYDRRAIITLSGTTRLACPTKAGEQRRTCSHRGPLEKQRDFAVYGLIWHDVFAGTP